MDFFHKSVSFREKGAFWNVLGMVGKQAQESLTSSDFRKVWKKMQWILSQRVGPPPPFVEKIVLAKMIYRSWNGCYMIRVVHNFHFWLHQPRKYLIWCPLSCHFQIYKFFCCTTSLKGPSNDHPFYKGKYKGGNLENY